VNGRLRLMIVTLLLAGGPCLYSKQSKSEGRPRLTLIQCDMAGIPPRIRLRAKSETTRIFDRAGVDVIWIEAEAGCKIPSMDRCFIVVVVPLPPEAWNKPYATGFAPVRNGAYRRAYIFYDRVTSVAKTFSLTHVPDTVGVILGHAVAHELGHLLLPDDAHSPNGIMRDEWNFRLSEEAAAGRLLFSENQTKVIREELRAN